MDDPQNINQNNTNPEGRGNNQSNINAEGNQSNENNIKVMLQQETDTKEKSTEKTPALENKIQEGETMKQTNTPAAKKEEKTKQKLSLFDKLKGISTIDEKNLIQELNKLDEYKDNEKIIEKCKAFLDKTPDSKIIKKLHENALKKKKEIELASKEVKKEEPKKGSSILKQGNVFTKLFRKNKSSKDESLIDTIVTQVETKETKEKEKVQKMKEKEKEDKVIGKLFKEKIHSRKEEKKITPIFKWEYYVFIFSMLFFIGSSIFFYTELNEDNMILSLAGIENVGELNKNLHEKSKKLKQEINKSKGTLHKLERNEIVADYVDDMEYIKSSRMNWIEILKKVEKVVKKVPKSYFDDVLFNTFSGQAKESSITLSGEVKNIKVFTLTADLLDEFENSPYFFDIDYSKFSKKEIQESKEFKSTLRFTVKYLKTK